MIVRRPRLWAPSRRALLTGAGNVALIAQANANGLLLATGSSTGPAFPGQAGNPVGFAAAPGYPGSLTSTSGPFTSGSVGSPNVYSFLDFDGGTSGLYLDSTHNYINFVGCRFQSNSTANINVQVQGATNINWSYCSITPRTALVTAPPNAAWPSAGAGQGVIEQPQPSYQITAANCYQYGFQLSTAGAGGPFTMDHCDIWGGQNAVSFYNTTTQINVTDCWIHDWADSLNVPHTIGGTATYHQDGPGYLNSGTGPNNVTINHCTIAGIANGNMLAFQTSTGGENNLVLTNNFMCGGSTMVFLESTFTNSAFTDNFFATDIPWQYAPFHADYTSLFHLGANGNSWARNKLRVLAGTAPYAGATPAWTSGDDGKFMWPDGTLHVTDFV